MKKEKSFILMLFIFTGLVFSPQIEASIFISEILADPPVTVGDANQDGVVSTSQDEFVELYNDGGDALDLSGWSLTDAVSARHVFGSGSVIDSYSYFVVFGGGTPTITSFDWQTASSGSLGLNNSGDTVSLFDAQLSLMDEVFYGREGGRDQSIVRGESGEWLLIANSEEGASKFSPGAGIYEAPVIDQEIPEANNAVAPEPATWAMMAFGMLGMGIFKSRICVA